MDYGHAIVSVALWAILVQVLNFFSADRKAKAGLVPGATPKADYADPLYRLDRAYHNAAETLAVFVAVVAAAILAGASPFWVNLFAALAFLSRLAMVYVHLKGIGKLVFGPRTIFFVVGWALMIALALMAIAAVFW